MTDTTHAGPVRPGGPVGHGGAPDHGAEEPPPAARRSVREVVEDFAGSLACGALDRLAVLVTDDVVVRTPGRSRLAGDHHGRAAALRALAAPPADGVRLAGNRVTEILVDGAAALVVLELSGSDAAGTDFRFEVAFHVATDGERVIGVTEYSADQHTADGLLESP